MFNKMKERLAEDEFDIDDIENERDILDEGDDILVSKLELIEARKEQKAQEDLLDSSLDDLV